MFDNFIHCFYYLFFYYKKGEKTKKKFRTEDSSHVSF